MLTVIPQESARRELNRAEELSAQQRSYVSFLDSPLRQTPWQFSANEHDITRASSQPLTAHPSTWVLSPEEPCSPAGWARTATSYSAGGLQTFNLPQGGSGGDYAASGEETQHIWTRARVPGKGITEKVPRSHAGSRLRHSPLCNFRLGSRGQAGRLPERSLSKVSKLQWDFRSPFGHLRKTGLV